MFHAHQEPCDSDAPCAEQGFCHNGTCSAVRWDSECLGGDSNVHCLFSGPAGAVVQCPLRIVRESDSAPTPSGLEFSLAYADSQTSILGMKDEACFAPDLCFAFNVPPANIVPQGHAVSLDPNVFADWQGAGVIILANFTGSGEESPNPITEAYLDASGEVVGEDQVAYFLFELDEDVAASTPTNTVFSSIIVVDFASFELVNQLIYGSIVVGEE